MDHPPQRFRCENCGNEAEISPITVAADVLDWPTPRCAGWPCRENGYPVMAMLPGPISPKYLHVGLGGHRV